MGFSLIRTVPTNPSNYFGTNTAEIDASEINVRLGKSSTAELSASDSDFRDSQSDYSTQSSISWAKALNMFTVTVDQQNIFGNDYRGYYIDPGQQHQGSISRDTMAMLVEGGWYMNSSSLRVKIRQMYVIQNITMRVQLVIGSGASTGNTFTSSNQGWTSFKITTAPTGTHTNTRSYGSFTSSSGQWSWSGNSNVFSGTDGDKEHIRIF